MQVAMIPVHVAAGRNIRSAMQIPMQLLLKVAGQNEQVWKNILKTCAWKMLTIIDS